MVSEASYHSWSTGDLCVYVKANLPESEAVDIIEKLKYHSIRGAHLDEIKPDDLLYMGITKWGHRRSLLGLIEKIRRSSQSTPPKETSPATNTPTGSPPADIIVYPINKFVPLSMQFGLTNAPTAPASGSTSWSSSSSRTTSPSSTPEGEAIEGEPGYASKTNHPVRPTPMPATGHSVPIASRQSIAPIIANRSMLANGHARPQLSGYNHGGSTYADVDQEGAAPGSPVDLSMLDEDDIMANGVANLNINPSLSSSVPLPAGPMTASSSSSPASSMFSSALSLNGPRLYSKLCSIKDCSGENCDRAHSLSDLYCRFCDCTGHSGDKHRDDTRCMHCNSPDHSVLHCKRNTDLCYMTGARHNEKYCAYVHSPDNARCAYCLASNHILAMCASETIRCIRCRNTSHHDSNPLKCPMHPEYPYYAAILAKMGRDIRDIKPKVYKNVQDILFYDWRDAGVSLIEFADGIARYKLAKKGKQAINAPKHEQIAMNIHANMNNNSPINPMNNSINSLPSHGSLSLGGSPTNLSPIIVKHQPQYHSGNPFEKRHDFVSTHDF